MQTVNTDVRHITRRHFLQALGFVAGNTALASGEGIQRNDADARENQSVEYGRSSLPRGVRSRRVDTNNDVVLHVLEAGFETTGKPCVVLLHGFPELAYCWRNQLLPLARAGFHVIAPDLRGYGLSAPKAVALDDDLLPYSMLNRVGDVLGLARALGYEKLAAVVGHDWGGPTAQWCARLRPDVFQSVVSMSTPFLNAPALPLGTAENHGTPAPEVDIEKELAGLTRPRKHYFWYSATRAANEDMWHAPQGVHDLLREFYYFKSADWKGNKPFPLKGWTAPELAKMPTYYIMDLNKGIAATMAKYKPSSAEIAACKWMTEADLQVYSHEFQRTGFQGGLNYYRVSLDSQLDRELNAFAGKTIDVPAYYIGGSREWAVYQTPGAFEGMHSVCTQLKGVHLVDGAGHSIAEEQPEAVNRLLIEFLTSGRLT
jgi:pimeloyl-ACP methyl ester carboxylesterase